MNITNFVPYVEFRVSVDTPPANIHLALRESARQFLEQSRAAVDTTYAWLDCNDEELYIELLPCHRLVQVLGVYCAPMTCGVADMGVWNRRWECIPQDMAPEECPGGDCGGNGWRHDLADGMRHTIWVPQAKSRRRFAVRYSWTTSRAMACDVPDWLFEDHAEAVANGALELLHMNPVDDAANPAFGKIAGAAFYRAVEEARGRMIRGYGPGHFKLSARGFLGG